MGINLNKCISRCKRWLFIWQLWQPLFCLFNSFTLGELLVFWNNLSPQRVALSLLAFEKALKRGFFAWAYEFPIAS